MTHHRPPPLWMRATASLLALIVPLNCCPVSLAESANPTISLTGVEVAQLDPLPAPELPPKGVQGTSASAVPDMNAAGAVDVSRLPENPSTTVLSAFPGFPEPLKMVGALADDGTSRALAVAINAWRSQSKPDDLAALQGFVDANPASMWTPSLQYNMGQLYYRSGYFSRAIDAYKAAWDGCATRTEEPAARLANQAVAELAALYARVGRKSELTVLLQTVKDRLFEGNAKVQLERAADGLDGMINRPGVSFRCGTHALNSVAGKLKIPVPSDFLESLPSTETGFSLTQLQQIAGNRLNKTMKMIRRPRGSVVPVPSVMHLRCGHYGALVEVSDGQYLLKDPTFGNDTWMSLDAIESEASGYFLIPAETNDGDYHTVSPEEGSGVFGKGNVGSSDPRATTPCDPNTNCPGSKGMATYGFHLMLASLHITDTPLEVPTAYGPGLALSLAYNQREAFIAETRQYTHFSSQWVCNLVSYLEDNTTNSSADITIYLPGGGSEIHHGYTSTGADQGNFTLQEKSVTRLVRVSAGVYERVSADGSKLVYARALGSTGNPRKIFLSKFVDGWGNALTLQYDSLYPARMTSAINASGQVIYFFYQNAEDPYLCTAAADNSAFAQAVRKASFGYQSTNGKQRLASITDPVGIVSSFDYDSTGFLKTLRTPYGSTAFVTGTPDFASGLKRWVEATDPNGDKERVEFRMGQPGPDVIGSSIPVGSGLGATSFYGNFRNSFYWDKKAWREGAGDFTKAHLYHWLHTADAHSAAGILEREKCPLENDTWYNYPGQSSSINAGKSSVPSIIARAVEGPDGTVKTAIQRTSFHELTGNVVQTTDPDGHTTRYNYDSSGFDLLSVQAQDGAAWRTLYTEANYVNHRAQLITKADGTTVSCSYNSKGQPLVVTTSGAGNTLTTRYTYDSPDVGAGNGATCGFLLRTEQTSPQGAGQFVILSELTYDAAKRPLTVTDAQGYIKTVHYDALDRPTMVVHPDGTTEQVNYAQDGKMILQPTATKDRSGRWTRTRYNALGQPILIIDPAFHGTTYEWCKCGSLSRLTDPMGKTTFWKRDIQGRVTYKEMSDGKRYNYTYQPLSGRLGTVAFPNDVDAGQVTFTNFYSLSGQLLKKDYRDPAMADVSFQYADYLGRVTQMTDGIGTTNYTYNPFTPATLGAGQLFTVNGPLANDTLRYSYDWLGRAFKTEVLKDDGTVTRSEQASFDVLGRTATVVNDLGTFTSIYTAGNLSAVPDTVALPGGYSSAYTLYPLTAATAANAALNKGDALRLATITHKDAANTILQNHGYAYNLDGDIMAWTQNTKRWDLQYDALGELTQQDSTTVATNTLDEKRSWAYDAAGNMLSRTMEQGSTKTMELRQHTGRNQLTSVGGGGRTLVDGTVNQPATVSVAVGSGAAQPARVSAQSATGPWRFQREADFPVGSTNLTITAKDANNNTRTQTYTVNVTDSETRSLAYDSNGNVRTKTYLHSGTPYRVETYTWDAENRLTGWQDKTLATQTAPEIITASSTWQYDGLSRRVKEHNVQGATTTDKTLLWSGLEMIQWQNPDGKVQRNLFTTGEQLMPSTINSQPSTLIYLTDHLGSIRAWYSPADNTRSSADYSAYGIRTITANTAAFIPARSFTGHYQHEVSGLVLAPYRVYDADFGRWISEDPIEEKGGVNLYGYAGGGVVRTVDPSGLYFEFNDLMDLERDLEQCFNPKYRSLTGRSGQDDGAAVVGVATAAAIGLAQLPSATVAVGNGARTVTSIPGAHVAFGASGQWLHGLGEAGLPFTSGQTITAARAVRAAANAYKFAVPVLSEAAVLGEEGQKASSCIVAATRGVARGWWKPIWDALKSLF